MEKRPTVSAGGRHFFDESRVGDFAPPVAVTSRSDEPRGRRWRPALVHV